MMTRRSISSRTRRQHLAAVTAQWQRLLSPYNRKRNELQSSFSWYGLPVALSVVSSRRGCTQKTQVSCSLTSYYVTVRGLSYSYYKCFLKIFFNKSNGKMYSCGEQKKFCGLYPLPSRRKRQFWISQPLHETFTKISNRSVIHNPQFISTQNPYTTIHFS